MPAPIKPSFNPPDVQSLQQSIDKLDDALRDVKMGDGSLDVRTLEERLRNDPELQRGVEVIKDAFQRTETREVTGCGGTPVSSGCGGAPATREVSVDPKNLEAGEVQSVLQALAAAKQSIAALDTNRDGKLQRGEAEKADSLTGLPGELANTAVAGTVRSFKDELHEWRKAVTRLVEEKEDRQSFDRDLKSVAGKHAQTDLGRDAILWAYRDLSTQGDRPSPRWDIDETLKDAETSFLRFVPFFRGSARGEGHLNDREIADLFRTDDLQAFIAGKKAAIEARIGGSYEAHFLAGKDLPGIEQQEDPDFMRARTGC